MIVTVAPNSAGASQVIKTTFRATVIVVLVIQLSSSPTTHSHIADAMRTIAENTSNVLLNSIVDNMIHAPMNSIHDVPHTDGDDFAKCLATKMETDTANSR